MILYLDIEDDHGAECLPRYVIVTYIIQEAELRLKSRYEIEEITNDLGDKPADIFGYCANVHSLDSFQESFPSAADKEKPLKKAEEIMEEKKMKHVEPLFLIFLFVHGNNFILVIIVYV